MSESKLELRFESPDGAIELHDITTSLVAINSLNGLVVRSQKLPADAVVVRVVPFRAGSFRLILEYALEHGPEVAETLLATAHEVSTVAKNVSSTLVDVLRVVKEFPGIGHRDDITLKVKNEKTEVSDGDRKILVQTESVEIAARGDAAERLARDVLKPAKDSKINAVNVVEDGERVINYSRDELDRIELVGEHTAPGRKSVEYDGEFEVTTERVTVLLRSPSFEEDLVWRISDKDHNFGARLTDPEFLARANSGFETFKAGDFLDIELVTRRPRSGAYGSTTREITHVFDHFPGQPTLEDGMASG